MGVVVGAGGLILASVFGRRGVGIGRKNRLETVAPRDRGNFIALLARFFSRLAMLFALFGYCTLIGCHRIILKRWFRNERAPQQIARHKLASI